MTGRKYSMYIYMKTLPKEDIKMVSRYMKKMLKVISHKGNAS